MNKELLAQAQILWDQTEKVSKFSSKYEIYPYQKAGAVLGDMQLLQAQISDIENPSTTEELHESELKRNLASKSTELDRFLGGKPYSLEDIVAIYGLDAQDLTGLKGWLSTHKAEAAEATERLFDQTDVTDYEFDLSSDIPRIRQQAEGYTGIQVANYHQKLGTLFEGQTAAGSYLHRISSEPSTTDRSYFNPKARRLALSMQRICYELEDGTIQVRERELLRLFGHEGMGHALQRVISESSNLPFFLKEGSNASMAADEAIAQHYERVIFEDVHASPKTQRELRISDNFEDIYKQVVDTQQIKNFNKNLFFYTILVLADKSLGHPKDPETIHRRKEMIDEVAISSSYAHSMVERHRNHYDSQGNLSSQLLSELRYSSTAVERAFKHFQKKGIQYDNRDDRSRIDLTFLTGYFTPVGFVQKAELASTERL